MDVQMITRVDSTDHMDVQDRPNPAEGGIQLAQGSLIGRDPLGLERSPLLPRLLFDLGCERS